MQNTFFVDFKKALSVSTSEVRSVAVEKNPDTGTPTGIQRMTAEEYSAVAGGPQVENEPEGG